MRRVRIERFSLRCIDKHRQRSLITQGELTAAIHLAVDGAELRFPLCRWAHNAQSPDVAFREFGVGFGAWQFSDIA